MKRSKLLLVAAVLSTLYTVYLVTYFGGAMNGSESSAAALGAGLATALVAPHMVVVAIATVFNWIAWALRARWAALTAGILYAVGMVVMFMYAIFVILQTIFCFVAFAKMKTPPKAKE